MGSIESSRFDLLSATPNISQGQTSVFAVGTPQQNAGLFQPHPNVGQDSTASSIEQTLQTWTTNPSPGSLTQPASLPATALPGLFTHTASAVGMPSGVDPLTGNSLSTSPLTSHGYQAKGMSSAVDPLTGQALSAPITSASGYQAASLPAASSLSTSAVGTFTATLFNDTAPRGQTNQDGITSDPRISGFIEDSFFSGFISLTAWFNDSNRTIDISVKADGTFSLSETQLNQLWGSPLSEGQHTLHLEHLYEDPRITEPRSDYLDLSFTLDRTAPQLSLATPTPLTANSHLIGTANGTGSSIASLTYRFDNLTNTSVTVNAAGNFDQSINFTGVSVGNHILNLSTTDLAGNSFTTTRNVQVLSVPLPPTPPTLTLKLLNDTAPGGTTNTDAITTDPSITGTVKDDRQIARFEATLDNSTVSYDLRAYLPAAGGDSFTLNQPVINLISRNAFGTDLTQGTHILNLVAADPTGNTTRASLSFTFDSVAPLQPRFTLAPEFDTAPLGDFQTNAPFITLMGQSDPNASILLQQSGAVILSDATGRFEIPNIALALGDNPITLQATDAAGNQSLFTQIVQRLSPVSVDTKLQATLRNDTAPNGQTDSDSITRDPSIQGQITGFLPQTQLWVRLAESANPDYQNISSTLNPDRTFSLTAAQLATLYGNSLPDRSYTVLLQARNADGTVLSSFSVPFTLDTTAPQLTLSTPAATNPLTGTSFISGSIQDAGSGVVSLSYRLNDRPPVPLSVNPNGTFNQKLSLSGIPNGPHTLTVIGTDQSGNQTTHTQAIQLALPLTITPLIPGGSTNPTNATSTLNLRLALSGIDATTPFWAGLDTQPESQFVSVIPHRDPDGSIYFDCPQLEALNGGPLSEGAHTLNLQTQDALGNRSAVFAIAFTLDLTAPVVPTLTLPTTNVSGVSQTSDLTSLRTPLLQGTAEAGSTLQLFINGIPATQTKSDGTWRLLSDPLADGTYQLTATATDAAGNTSPVSAPLTVTIDATPPQLTLTSLASDAILGQSARLTGQLQDAHRIIAFSYRFDNQADIPVALAPDGSFDQLIDFTGIADGAYVLTCTSTDAAGNVMTETRSIVADPNGTLPLVSARLLDDSGSSASDGITSDPTVIGNLDRRGGVTLWGRINSNADYTELTGLVQPNGSYTLDREQLAALAGGELPDGSYTLDLQAKTPTGDVLKTEQIAFTLDTTVPNITLQDLINGIAWKNGRALRGTGEIGSHITYRLDNQAEITLNLDNAGAFNQNLPTLPAGVHKLSVSALDDAGNQQTQAFKFLLKQTRRSKDTETDSSTPHTDPIPTGGRDYGISSSGGGGGGSSSGWSWGGGSGGGTGYSYSNYRPPNWDWMAPPDGQDNYWSSPYIDNGYGYEPPISYQDRIEVILDEAAAVMPVGSKRAALINRHTLLRQDAANVEAGGFYKQMDSTLYGIYYIASVITRASQARNVGDYLAVQLNRPDDPAVKVQVLQTSLLTVVNHYLQEQHISVSEEAYKTLVQSVLELGDMYASLDPQGSPITGVGETDFLSALWRKQGIEGNLEASEKSLTNLLAGVQDPVKAISFIDHLLQAATNVADLEEDMQNATFLQELVKFGAEVARLNPVVTDSSNSNEAVSTFLNTLWRDGNTEQAQGGLSDFFEGLNTTEDRIKGLEFANNLVKAAQLLPSFGEQARDANFLGQLINLGLIYIQLGATQVQDSQSLFETLFKAQNIGQIQQGIKDVGEMFKLFDSFSKGLTTWTDETEQNSPNNKGLLEDVNHLTDQFNQFNKEVTSLSNLLQSSLETAEKYGEQDAIRSIQARLDKIEKNYVPHSSLEGSGKHGVRSPNKDDYFLLALLAATATIAEARGEKNAAKHLRHYLGNSGKFLVIDAQNLYQNSYEVRGHVKGIKEEVLARALSGPTNIDYEIVGKQKSGYVRRDDSKDWFFAMGGYTYWYTAQVKAGSSRVVEVKIHFKDVYNWDQKKITPIEGLRFSDKVLGSLHQAGIAQEYSMGGSLFFTWKY